MTHSVFQEPCYQRQLDRRGFVIVPLLDAVRVAELARFFAAHAHQHQTGFGATMLSRDFAYRAAAGEAVTRVLGDALNAWLSRFEVFTGGFTTKAPRQEAAVFELHQDMSFTDETQVPCVNIWCPLVDVGPHNGWLEVVPGSHRLNRNFREAGRYSYAELHDILRERFVTPLPMKAGEAVIYYPGTLHRSPGNQTETLRVVSVATAAPVGSSRIFVHRASRSSDELELYEVPDTFYTRHVFGHPPEDVRFLRSTRRVIDPLDEASLAQLALAAADDAPSLAPPDQQPDIKRV